jgi:hypothetical protein
MKFLYFADTTERRRVKGGPKTGWRQGYFTDNSNNTSVTLVLLDVICSTYSEIFTRNRKTGPRVRPRPPVWVVRSGPRSRCDTGPRPKAPPAAVHRSWLLRSEPRWRMKTWYEASIEVSTASASYASRPIRTSTMYEDQILRSQWRMKTWYWDLDDVSRPDIDASNEQLAASTEFGSSDQDLAELSTPHVRA